MPQSEDMPDDDASRAPAQAAPGKSRGNARGFVAARLAPALWTALLCFALDRAAKLYVLDVLDLDRTLALDIFPPYLNLLMAWNDGANFGLGDELGRDFWIAAALLISGGLLFWAGRMPDRPRRILIGLLVGGALGNALDRALYGAVADFLNMSCCGYFNPYAFNPADIFIFLGAIGLALAPEGEGEPDRADPPAR